MTPRPTDPQLYERVRARLYAECLGVSAYRSGLLVQRYRAAGGTYVGAKPKPEEGGLARWLAEEWRSPDGGIGYSKRGDVYRPTRRVSADTPTTFSELTAAQVRRAQKEKKATGRVKAFAP